MKLSQLSLLITVAMIVVFYFLISEFSSHYKSISIIFFGAILVLRAVTFSIVRKNMIADDVPDDYIKKYFLSWLITTAGVILFVFLLIK